MIKKILILSFILCLVSCFAKKNTTNTKGSNMLLEKIINDIKLKSTEIFYKLPDHKVITLDNKLQIIFMPDNLPYIHFKLRLNAGQRFEDLEGAAESVASLLDKGTSTLNREEILSILDKIGASFSASAGQEFSWIEASSLAKNETDLMNLFFKLLTEPVFLDKEWQKEKQIILTELERLPNSPNKFLKNIFDDFIYNKTVYKGESRQSVNALKRDNLIKFYNKHYQPESASLLVLGQYTDKLKKDIIQKFSNWKTKDSVASTIIKSKNTFNSSITLINKTDSIQANVIIGNPVNLSSGHPDNLAVKLANFSLGGGGFNSRLMDRVRKKDGLTYAIYSGFGFLKNSGAFQIVSSTNQGSLEKLLKATFQELTNFYNNGVSKAELDFSKLYYSNSLFRGLEKKETLMDSFLSLSGMNIDPVNYFETFSSKIKKIDLNTVNMVIKKYFNPKDMKIFVLANKDSKGGESNPKNKGSFTIIEQLNNFSKEFISHKDLDIKDYKDINY
ncbi:MAG: insulinase family protein [Bdellovibrionales bacterium]|nr:insulinase family protein [Bdellovibrionales bacterium]